MKKSIETLTFERMQEESERLSGMADRKFFVQSDIALAMGMSQMFKKLAKAGQPLIIQDFRCGYVQRGELRSIINLVEHRLPAGTLAFLTPGSIIQPFSISDDFEIVGMAVSDEVIRLALGQRLPDIFSGKAKDGQLPVDGKEVALLHEMYQLLWNVVHAETARREVVLNLVAAIAHEFDSLFSQSTSTRNASPSTQKNILNHFIRLVNEHCNEQHQMAFYADRMCLTERYLGSVVRQTSGITAKQWIDRALVTSAKVMLKHTDHQVTRISDDLHFPNVSFFCKYFKRLTGLSPQEYREG